MGQIIKSFASVCQSVILSDCP